MSRLHPTSMFFRIVSHGRALLLPGLAVLFVAGSGWELWLMALFVPSVSFELLRYLTLRYGFVGPDLVVRHGLIFKVERHVPLERIQNIDLVQNPLHRLMRVAEVRVETAGGSEPEAVLKVLSLEAVERLRRSIFDARSATASPAQPPDGTPAAPTPEGHRDAPVRSAPDVPAGFIPVQRETDRLLLHLGTGELIKVGVISLRGMALVAVLFGIAWELDLEDHIDVGWIQRGFDLVKQQLGPFALVAAGVLMIAAAITTLYALSIAWAILRLHDFRLMRAGQDLRLRCGLLTRMSATVPRRRVQFITVRQTVVHRLFDRVAVRVETAGGHKENDDTISRKWFVPIATAEQAAQVLREVRPGLDLQDAPWQPLSAQARRRMMRMGVILDLIPALVVLGVGTLWLGWWVSALALVIAGLSIWHTWAKVRLIRWAMLPGGVALRSGVLTRNTSATFFDKIQSLRLSQSPFDRRWGMATLSVDTAGAGPAGHRIQIPYLELETARAALRVLTGRAEVAEFTW